MSEREGVITFKGGPMTLVGDELSVGQAAPDFTLKGNDLSEVKLADYAGKKLILVTIPSLDTPVCDPETRRFNEEAGKLGDGVAVLVVSVDLPFAQARWCGQADATNITTASDYLDHAFGVAYGVRIKELGLLARTVSVIDADGKVTYHEMVKEVTEEPNYDAALAAAS